MKSDLFIPDINTDALKKYPKPPADVYLSLEEYINIAKKCIRLYKNPDIKSKLLNSEDAISYIVNKIMMGEWKWSENRNCSRKTYRILCAKWAIKYLSMTISTRKNKYNIVSFNQSFTEDGLTIEDSYDNTPVNPKYDNADLTRLIQNSNLSPAQIKYLNMRRQGLEITKIAKTFGVSKQNVQQSIDQSIAKMKMCAGR